MRKITGSTLWLLTVVLILFLSVCSCQTKKPANFSISALTVSPNKVVIGQPVNIEAMIANTGDISGTYSVVLLIDDITEAEEEVTLDGKSSQKVDFTVTRNLAKSYIVEIGGETSTFRMTLGKIIVDVAHGAKPQQISRYLGQLQVIGYDLYEKSDVIQGDDLNGASILMLLFSLDTEQPYTSSEIALIDEFIKEGGGLLVIGENVWNEQHLSYINEITGNYGIRYNFDLICDPTDYTGYAGPKETTPIFTQGNASHPILKGVDEIRCSYSNSLRISGPAKPIVWGDEDSFTAVANSSNTRLQEPGTNPTFIALSQVETGRVVCVGSSTPFEDFAFEDGSNHQLGLNLVNFVAWSSAEP